VSGELMGVANPPTSVEELNQQLAAFTTTTRVLLGVIHSVVGDQTPSERAARSRIARLAESAAGER
jgi:hypothetical protein